MRAGIRLNFAAYTLTRMPFGGSRPAESRRAKAADPSGPNSVRNPRLSSTQGFHAAKRQYSLCLYRQLIE